MKTLQPECLQAALAYLKLGWSAIPLCPPNHEKVVHKGHLDSCHRPGKTPLWQWKGYQERLPRDTELKLWWNKNPYCNVGIALGPVSGLVGLDVDSVEGHGLLLQWSDGTAIPPTLEFKTPHGFRLFFKWQQGIPIQSFRNADNKEILRVLAKGSQTVLPPSKLAKGVYFWVPGHGPGEIEPAPLPEWLTPHLVVPSNTKGDDQGVGGDGFQIAQNTPPSPPNALERAIAYLTKCNPCVAGQGGHNQLFKVCCHLVHGLHLDQHSALFVLLQDYNGRCKPPWSEQELTHKIKEAAEKGTAPDMGPSKDSSSKWGEPAPPTKPEEKKIAFPIPYSDHDVATKVFPPIKWAIPGIAPEGAIILAGRPKMGKSWMILQWLMAIAVGGKVFGKIAVESGDALYLALEDSERRIQKRRNRVAESLHYGTLPSLYYVNEWPRMTELTRGSQTVLMPSNQAFDGLSYWLDAHPLARIIAVDTLAKFRPRSNGKNSYQADYDAMSQIQEFATKRQICIVVVTHTRKHRAGEDEDVLDEIQDTTGVTGAVDATCVLKRERYSNLAQLHITGRDVDERNIPLVWDKEKFLWLQNETEESDPAQVIPANRLVVLQAFGLAGQEVMDIPSLAMACKKNYDAMAKHLERMVKEGLLKKSGQGAYKLSEQTLSKMSKMSKST